MIKGFDTGKKKSRGRPKGSLGKVKANLEQKVEDCSPEKVALIKQILELEPIFQTEQIDLTPYTIEQLKKHIELFKNKGRNEHV